MKTTSGEYVMMKRERKMLPAESIIELNKLLGSYSAVAKVLSLSEAVIARAVNDGSTTAVHEIAARGELLRRSKAQVARGELVIAKTENEEQKKMLLTFCRGLGIKTMSVVE